MNKQKRMVYIYEENVEYYDSLKNKSEFINEKIRLAKRTEPLPHTSDDPNWHPDPRIRETRKAVAAMDAKRKADEAKSHVRED